MRLAPGGDCAPDDWLCRTAGIIQFGLDVKDQIEDPRRNHTEIERIKAEAAKAEAEAKLAAAQNQGQGGSDLTPWLIGGGAVVLVVVLLLVVKRD